MRDNSILHGGMKLIHFLMGLVTVLLLVACHQKKPLGEVEITRIAREACIRGWLPVVELYRDMYIHAIDKDNSRLACIF